MHHHGLVPERLTVCPVVIGPFGGQSRSGIQGALMWVRGIHPTLLFCTPSPPRKMPTKCSVTKAAYGRAPHTLPCYDFAHPCGPLTPDTEILYSVWKQVTNVHSLFVLF